MPTLKDAYDTTKFWLTADTGQVQGTCGLYSFWYASVLLLQLEQMELEAKRLKEGSTVPAAPMTPDFFPRTKMKPGINWAIDAKCTESLRHYAKQKLNSGQGEILTGEEMRKLVKQFKYKAQLFNPKKGNKERFITDSINSRKPVIFSYSISQTSKRPETAGSTTKADIGSHFSVIIGMSGSNYECINPWNPASLQTWGKTQVLNSNAAVDNQTYTRFWAKLKAGDLTSLDWPAGRAIARSDFQNWEKKMEIPSGVILDKGEPSERKTTGPLSVKSLYDLYKKPGILKRRRKQKLKDLLVAVWK